MDEIDDRLRGRLRRLYARPVNKVFFDWAAYRERNASETTVSIVARRCQIDHEAAVSLLRDLAAAGLGRFIRGRGGAKTRIEWDYNLCEIGKAAQSGGGQAPPDDIDDADRDEGDVSAGPRMIEHTFNLRSDMPIVLDLPDDLTRREAERLAAFIHTLPLDE